MSCVTITAASFTAKEAGKKVSFHLELWEINYRERGSLDVLVWLAGLHWNQDVVNVWPLTGSPTPEYTHAFQSEAQSLLFTHVGLWAAQVKL